MPIQVKIGFDAVQGTCATCGTQGVVVQLSVSGELNSEPERICTNCVRVGKDITVDLEPRQLNKGRRPPSKRTMDMNRRLERDIAQDTNGRTQPGSGNKGRAKGDVRVKGKFRIEEKSTEAGSFRLTREVLTKITSEAKFPELPVVVIHFTDKERLRVLDSWAVIPYSRWLEGTHGTGDD